jgi:predicted O-methyltransferase YrrM
MFLSNFRLKTTVQAALWNIREIMDYPLLHPGRELQQRALIEAADYLERLPTPPPSFPTARELLRYALEVTRDKGSVVELGVYKGATIRFIARHLPPNRTVHGFDTFTGLPIRWTGNTSAFDAGGALPRVPNNVELHVGLFADTLPAWARNHDDQIALLHVDCDVYESASSALRCLADWINEGTVIVFDEYFNYPGWQHHEFKAFQEFVSDRRIEYTYLGYSRIQVAVRIDRVGVPS